MKTIIENSTKLSKYLLDDDTPVAFINGQIHVGDPNDLDFIIGDLSDDNASLIENVVNAPEDWFGNKYTFDLARSSAEQWKYNPDYIEAASDNG